MSRAWSNSRDGGPWLVSQTRRLGTGFAVMSLLISMNLAYGVLHAADYGQSWDDPGETAYGHAVLRAYSGWSGYERAGDLPYYGPFYFMVSALASRVVPVFLPSWDPVDVRHMLNFVSFQIGILAFYGISRRVLGRGAAVLATLVFAYQPLLFGHAFINQKDIPLLAAFLVAVFLGFRMVDSTNGEPLTVAVMTRERRPPSMGKGFARGWRESSRIRRALLVGLALAGTCISADLIWGNLLVSQAQAVVALAYRGEAWAPLTSLFRFLAEDAYKTPVGAYLDRVAHLFGWVRLLGVYLCAAPALILGLRFAAEGGADLSGLGRMAKAVVPAAVALGMAMSIRVVGAYAGAVVGVALLLSGFRKSVPILAFYGLLALDFPAHFVLFRGREMSSGDLPWDYLPTLLSIQLTEASLLLVGVGFAGALAFARRIRAHSAYWIPIGLWLAGPLIGSLFLHLPLFGNFRQVLFAVPPLFIVSGLGIEVVWTKISGSFPRIAFAILILLPGFVAILQLRPYEYIYYNSLVGGPQGVEGLFVHDYWCTSIREAMAHVNSVAPRGARVSVSAPPALAAAFARPDLELVRAGTDPQTAFLVRCNDQGDFTSRNLDEFPGIYAVTRSGVPLSIVLPQEPAPEGAP
ncbi:MAG: hypothetical protein HW376_112 [candidate division NC10 bacterium]|nr:hypothetical protein [candidate division NC10 bacterium]